MGEWGSILRELGPLSLKGFLLQISLARVAKHVELKNHILMLLLVNNDFTMIYIVVTMLVFEGRSPTKILATPYIHFGARSPIFL